MRCVACVAAVVVVAMMAGLVKAYPVSGPLSLDQVAEKADIVVKVKAIESKEVKDEWFRDYSRQGFGVFETTFQKISVIQGEVQEEKIRFRHYDETPQDSRRGMPQWYHFETGKSYLVFAAKGDVDGTFRQLWQDHTTIADQGAFRCADDKATAKEASVKEVVWKELTGLLGSEKVEDVCYGIMRIVQMSRWTNDFKEVDAMAAILPLMASKDREVALAVISWVGGESPVMLEVGSPQWLGAKGKNPFCRRGIRAWEKMTNELATQHMAKLMAASESEDGVVRAAAIRAMLLGKGGPGAERLRKWTVDQSAAVRAAAACLWAEMESKESTDMLAVLAGDGDANVRMAGAYAIGYGQREELVPMLEQLLADKDEEVRRGTVLAILSLEPKVTKEVMERHTKEARYELVFRVALGAADPSGRREDLGRLLANPPKGEWYYISPPPLYTAWDILMDEVSKADMEEVKAGKWDVCLDGLDSPSQYAGFGPYQRLYEFYWKAGMFDRAKAFRDKAMERMKGRDIDRIFKEIDGRE